MPKTLLLADDSVTIQKVVGISFASEDVKLITVDNGDDAITRAREARPDLVLADVVMPGRNGYEVCAALKADPELRHIPVILLTGTFEAFDEERAREVGAASHVAKPFEAQTLVEEVKRVLAAPPPRPAPAAAPAVAPRNGSAPARPADLSRTPPASAGDSFDFFDEDLGDLSREPESWSEEPAGEPLDLEDDGAFAFGDESLDGGPADAGGEAVEIPVEPRWTAAPGHSQSDRTVAILTDLAEADTDGSIGEDDLHTLAPDPEEPLLPEVEPGRSDAGAGFDFAFDERAGSLVDPRHLAQDATVDPKGVSGFDISSSDLGGAYVPPPLPTRPRGLADTLPRMADEPVAEIEALEEGEPLGEAEALADALPLDDGEPLGASASRRDGPPAALGPVLDAIAPQLREQLHASLERIASESFREVADKLVRQTVERVEKIAWEVIPHMAETLVREEIRRMKGEK